MLSTKEISKKLGINEPTLRLWVRELDVPVQKSGTKLKFDNDALHVMEAIKDLREQDNGFNTIRKKINPVIAEELPRNDSELQHEYSVITSQLESIIERKLTENNGLAEKYARATFEIGQLQERVRGLEQQIQVLPAPDELTQAKAEIERLNQALNNEKQKSWWQKLFQR